MITVSALSHSALTLELKKWYFCLVLWILNQNSDSVGMKKDDSEVDKQPLLQYTDISRNIFFRVLQNIYSEINTLPRPKIPRM